MFRYNVFFAALSVSYMKALIFYWFPYFLSHSHNFTSVIFLTVRCGNKGLYLDDGSVIMAVVLVLLYFYIFWLCISVFRFNFI